MQSKAEKQNIATKNNSGGIVSDSVFLVFVRVVTLSVNLVQTMILSRTLTKTSYGTYSQAVLLISSLAPIFSLGLNDAINYFFNKSTEEKVRKKYVNTIFSLSILSGAICGIMILIFRTQIVGYFANDAVSGLLIYIAFRPCIQNLVALYQPLFISSGYAKTIAMRNLIISIGQICIVGGVSYFTSNIALIFLLLLVLDILQYACFVLIYTKRQFKISILKADVTIVREILRYALPLLLGTSIGTISINIDKFMVSGMMSTEDYALYANVSKELPFSFVISSFTAVVMPVIVRYINNGENNKFKELWSCYLELGYKITWPLCIGAAALAPEAIELLYSKIYLSADGTMVFRIYTIVAMMRFTFFGMVPSALGRTDIVMKYSIIGCAINICLNYPMFYLMGMPGPAMATVISMVVSAALYFRASSKLVNIRISEVLKPKQILLLGLEMLVCGIGIRLIVSTMELRFMNAFANFALGYVLFNVIVLGLNIKSFKRVLKSLKGDNG
ncbi:MAG: oligosaccharide flippase family protein [Lachnospiraceae bacterium]|jgi:O-antigen/teichoic acid export membrane protein|nr:oligosaccharide flippase family protein [Lachnospiraceae bacterium]